MDLQNYDHIQKIESILEKRQAKNPRYSLRSFARDLKLHPSTLCMVLKRKRKLPGKNLNEVLKELALNSIEESMFRDSFHRTKAKLDQIEIKPEFINRVILDEAYYEAIAEWEHFALLELITIPGFENSSNYIAKRLNITPERAQHVVENLKNSKLIKEEGGELILLNEEVQTTEDIVSKALRESHKESLEIAMSKIDDININLRDYSSETMAIDPEKIQEAKSIIREFRKKMCTLLSDGNKKEVYQLQIQFFPMTNIQENQS